MRPPLWREIPGKREPGRSSFAPALVALTLTLAGCDAGVDVHGSHVKQVEGTPTEAVSTAEPQAGLIASALGLSARGIVAAGDGGVWLFPSDPTARPGVLPLLPDRGGPQDLGRVSWLTTR